MTLDTINTLYKKNKEPDLFGRYISAEHIKPLLMRFAKTFRIDTLGSSVLNEDIYSITLGTGPKRILMWSQMHGNESTTTKALFDLLNLFDNNNDLSDSIFKACTIKIIPMLNPDGAKAYTRLNANNRDLNRDAQSLSEPESVLLRDCYNSFKPHYNFNLHGQRTIFSAGNKNKSATVSFLAPAQDKACTITNNRKEAMSIIVKMNNMLQLEIPNQVGIYDDSFNINCVGDTFQSFNVPTILFEAGHYTNDYDREEVRRLLFNSLLVGVNTIVNNAIDITDFEAYLKIPQNEKLFYDIIIKNANFDDEILDIGIQFHEVLVDNEIKFVPKTENIGNLSGYFSHKCIDANRNIVYTSKNKVVKLGNENDFVIINNVKLLLNILKR